MAFYLPQCRACRYAGSGKRSGWAAPPRRTLGRCPIVGAKANGDPSAAAVDNHSRGQARPGPVIVSPPAATAPRFAIRPAEAAVSVVASLDRGLGIPVMRAQPGGDTGRTEPVLARHRRPVHRLPWLVLAIPGIQAAFTLRLAWPKTAFQDEDRNQCWLRPAAL